MNPSALHLIAHPEEAGLAILLDGHDLLIRVIHGPSPATTRSWSIYRPRTAMPLLLVRLHWDPQGDKVVHRLANLPREQTEMLLKEAPALPLPFNPHGGMGLDGESWTIECGDHFHNARFQWSFNPPQPWQPFATWVATLVTRIDAAF
jgi:hypothetical protein